MTELGSAGGSEGDGEDCTVQALGTQPELSVISHYGVEIFRVSVRSSCDHPLSQMGPRTTTYRREDPYY